MKIKHSKSLISFVAMLVIVVATLTTDAQVPPEIQTPDRVESRLGFLNFKDGIPDNATAQKLFDEIDYDVISFASPLNRTNLRPRN